MRHESTSKNDGITAIREFVKRSERTRTAGRGARGETKTKKFACEVVSMKIETIDFRDFMSGAYRKPARTTRPVRTYAGFLPIITPQNLFPVHDADFALLMTGVGTITLAAFVERFLAHSGMPKAAQVVAEFGRFVFPVLAYGSVLWLFFFGLRGL